LGAFILVQTTLAQDGLTKITPKWQIGDERTVHVEASTTITIADTLTTETTITSDFRIKVVDTVENYILRYTQTSIDFAVEPPLDIPEFKSAKEMVLYAVQKLIKEVSSFEYEVLVNKESGLAFDLDNSAEYLNFIELASIKIVGELHAATNKVAVKKGIPEINIEKLNEVLLPRFKAAHPHLIQSVINGLNLLLQAYTYKFPISGSISEKTMVYPISALGEDGEIEYPATITLTSTTFENELVGYSKLDYDKTFFLEQMKKKTENLEETQASDLSMVENAEYVFDTNTTWIKLYKRNVSLELPNVRTVTQTTMTYK